jgi:phenylacetate-coenzyme A ligase PaaK-like adenylate-forming protein
VLDKATLIERFDDIVCDRRLRRDAILAHLDGLDRDALLPGGHRAMTSSGSTGRKSLFVYDRDGWAAICAQMLRFNAWCGTTPRLPRLKVAAVVGGSPSHMSRRVAATLGVGLHRILALPVTMPVDAIVTRLNAFGPDYLATYPSMAMLLAEQQQTGRLRLSLTAMSTSSELRTPETARAIEEAFGVVPADLYATTEGLWGATCGHGEGHHLFEDVTLVENVDADGRPVAPGERGARLLVTNLANRVQPLIRLEVSDVATVDPDPCPCGRTLLRVRGIEGRSEDVLRLPGRDGGVAVHPAQFALVTGDRHVREFQVVQHGGALRLRLAVRDGADPAETAERVRARLVQRLASIGVSEPAVEVELCDGLARTPSGKLQMVVADPSRA